MSSSRNLQSTVSVTDGSASVKIEKPKAPRASLCARNTADSAAIREKVAAKSKNSEILPNGGKFVADKAGHVDGSTPKRHVNKEKTSQERQLETATASTATEAATMRAQSKEKAESSSANQILFDKSKRQSMLSESMRRGAPTTEAAKQIHLQTESGRKDCASRGKQSTIFSSSDSASTYRPLRVVNIKTPERAEKATSNRTASEIVDDASRFEASSDAENQRKVYAAKSHSSSIFSTGASDDVRPGTASSVRSNSIFSGGAYAQDASSGVSSGFKAPRAIAAFQPPAATDGSFSARDRRDAALRGSGGLW